MPTLRGRLTDCCHWHVALRSGRGSGAPLDRTLPQPTPVEPAANPGLELFEHLDEVGPKQAAL
jgi:hypothetical protein